LMSASVRTPRPRRRANAASRISLSSSDIASHHCEPAWGVQVCGWRERLTFVHAIGAFGRRSSPVTTLLV
jgi:hypothetical protein